MKKQLIKIGMLLGVISMVLVSCSKLNDNISALTDEEIILAKDDVAADEVYIEIDGIVQDKLVELEESGFQPIAEKSAIDEYRCLEVTVDYPDSTRFPKVITFDYGEGCELILNRDTFYMEGKMLVTMTDHFFNPGAQKIVTFEDFYVDEKKVEGTLTNTCVGLNENEYLEFNLTVVDGKLIFADEEGNELTYTRDADFTRQWLRTRSPLEDTVLLDGSMWGENIEGTAYSREITETLVMVHCPDYGRRWAIIDGEVTSAVGDEVTVTDYSEGGCDGIVDIINAGMHQRIRIHERHRNRHHSGGGNGGN